MCDIEGETKVFADKINDLIINEKAEEIEKKIKEFESLGYKVSHKKLLREVYENQNSLDKELISLFGNSKNYQGTILRLPKDKFRNVFSEEIDITEPIKYEKDKVDDYILDQASKKTQLSICNILNYDSKEIDDPNLYLFVVYLTDKKKLLQRAKQGDEAARTTVWFSINDPCKLNQSALTTTPDLWVDEMIRVNGV